MKPRQLVIELPAALRERFEPAAEVFLGYVSGVEAIEETIYQPRYRSEVVAPIQNKLGALLSDPTLYRILVEPKVDLSFRRIMDDGGVFIANLAKGRLGEDSSAILGSLLVSTIGHAALSRADAPAEARRPFFLYVDEFQTFTTLAFANMMAELRKYGLGLTLAHQHFHQLEPDVRHNDPHGEHDFGSFDVDGERLFWKIDYYDPSLSGGSEDPADEAATRRVITIMLALEY